MIYESIALRFPSCFRNISHTRRPPALFLTGMLCLLWPLLNIVYLEAAFRVILSARPGINDGLLPLHILFIVFPVFIGAGLLLVRRWGLYMLVAYSGILILYNAVILFLNPVEHNTVSLIQTGLVSALLFFLVHRDLSASFMNLFEHDWLFRKRHPAKISIRINGSVIKTKVLDNRGFFISPADGFKTGQNLDVTADKETEGAADRHALRGVVVRIDDEGAGVALRLLQRNKRRKIQMLMGSK